MGSEIKKKGLKGFLSITGLSATDTCTFGNTLRYFLHLSSGSVEANALLELNAFTLKGIRRLWTVSSSTFCVKMKDGKDHEQEQMKDGKDYKQKQMKDGKDHVHWHQVQI